MTRMDTPAPRETYAAALDEQLARSLTPISFVLGAMYLTSVIHRAFDPDLRATTAPTAIIPTVVFLVLGALFVVRPVPARLANPVMMLSLGFMTVETLGRGEAAAGVNLHWALIGLGAVALRPRWVLGSIGAVVVPWALVAALGLNGWSLGHFGFDLDMVTATALGAVVFMARRSAVVGMFSARRELQRQAMRDPLTGLANRRGVEDGALGLLRTHPGTPLDLLFVDLDGFKEVNDRLGNAEGDRVLVAAAEVLRETFRSVDIVGRVGGDEFVVVLAPGTDREGAIERLGARIGARSADGHGITVGASVGTARVTGASRESFWQAIADADRHMYRVKLARRTGAADQEPERETASIR